MKLLKWFIFIALVFLAGWALGAYTWQNLNKPTAYGAAVAYSTKSPAKCSVSNFEQDTSCTPGFFDPKVTQSNLKKTICVKGYSSKVRNVPQSLKDAVYAEYGITSHPAGAYEIDHLASLELGGLNDIKNLWPQSYTGEYSAHMKDQLENLLHKKICDGSIKLRDAQLEITDWVTAYKKYIGDAVVE